MAGELRLNQVSVPTTPASGKDSLYVSTDTPERFKRVDSGGTIWPVQEQFIISQTAAYTPTATATTPFPAFNTTTNGAFNSPANISYQFDATYLITNTGTTSHTWGTLFGGTAGITSIAYWAQSVSATSNALTAPSQIYATAASNLVVTAASTSATENLIIRLAGIVRISTAGTLIPQLQTSATPGGTQTILTNSFFRMSPFASNTVGYLGNWT
jgi:hypothetical protein